MTNDTKTYPRVYIASPLEPVAGEWVPAVDANDEAERIREEYGHAEVICTDSEHMPHVESVPEAQRIAEAIEEHGPALGKYYTMTGTVEHFEDAYMGGGYDDLEDFAERYAIEIGMADRENIRYFDAEAFARDLDCSGWWIDDGHVFRPA